MIKSEAFLVDYRKKVVLQNGFFADQEIIERNNLYRQKNVSWRYMTTMELKAFFNKRDIDQIIEKYGVNKQKYSIN